jgi:hypothetical protein
MALDLATVEDAIEALITGAQAYTLPSGRSVTAARLDNLMALRDKLREEARDDAAAGPIIPQAVEFHD